MTIITTVAFTAKTEVEFEIPDSTPDTPAAIEAAIKKYLEGGMPTEFVELLDDASLDFISITKITESAKRPRFSFDV